VSFCYPINSIKVPAPLQWSTCTLYKYFLILPVIVFVTKLFSCTLSFASITYFICSLFNLLTKYYAKSSQTWKILHLTSSYQQSDCCCIDRSLWWKQDKSPRMVFHLIHMMSQALIIKRVQENTFRSAYQWLLYSALGCCNKQCPTNFIFECEQHYE